MLMARLATRTAKPDGQFCIPPEGVCFCFCFVFFFFVLENFHVYNTFFELSGVQSLKFYALIILLGFSVFFLFLFIPHML
jgi:hypothetical protein